VTRAAPDPSAAKGCVDDRSAEARGGLLQEVRRRQRLIVDDEGKVSGSSTPSSGRGGERPQQEAGGATHADSKHEARRPGVPSLLNSPGVDNVTVVVASSGAPLDVCSH
jgi:hypothetical protein